MASCNNNTGIDFWLNVPIYELNSWLEVLDEQQKSILDALKNAQKI